MAEPSWDDVEVGDKVVIEISGDVAAHRANGLISFKGGPVVDLRFADAVTTLKSIEKPVRTFKPGDVVRTKTRGGRRTVGPDGRRLYLHEFDEWVDYHGPLTSEYFELVE